MQIFVMNKTLIVLCQVFFFLFSEYSESHNFLTFLIRVGGRKSKANTSSLWGRRGDRLYCYINSYNIGKGRMIGSCFSIPAFQDPSWFYLLFHPWITIASRNLLQKICTRMHVLSLHQNHIYTDVPTCLFGAVSQSYLRCCL